MNNSSIQSSRETIYFILSVIFSIAVYVLAAVSIIGIGIALIIFAILLLTNALMLGSIRGNGIRIHEGQFPDVYERVQVLSKEMGLKKVPDVFIIQSEGALNAFATRFFGRDMVVLYSEVFELAREQGNAELDFIIAHELAHVKRRHVWKNLLIAPAGFIPFLAQAYSRSCEYTCDRHAAYTIQDPAAAKRALTLLGVGKVLYNEVNEEAYREQIKTESNAFVWFSEVSSTHPRLPKRIQAINEFSRHDGILYQQNHGKIALGAGLIFGGLFAVYIASVALFAGGSLVFSQMIPNSFASSFEDDLYSEDDLFYDFEGQTDLMVAANTGNLQEVQSLVESGADIDARDSEGSDALMYAIYYGDLAIVDYLVSQGADVNTIDDYNTALGTSINHGYYDIALYLIENGADPMQTGPDGENAIELMGASSEAELIEMLESGGF